MLLLQARSASYRSWMDRIRCGWMMKLVESSEGMILKKPNLRRRPEGAADRNGETPMDDPALVEALQAGDPQAPAC